MWYLLSWPSRYRNQILLARTSKVDKRLKKMGHRWWAGVEETCNSGNTCQLEYVFIVALLDAGAVGRPCLGAALGMQWRRFYIKASCGRPQGWKLLGRIELWRWSRARSSFDGRRSRQLIGYIHHQRKFGLNITLNITLLLFDMFGFVTECKINDTVFFLILCRFSFFFQNGSSWL